MLGGIGTWAVSDEIEWVTQKVTQFVDEAIGGEPSGSIILGSPNVFVNNKPLAMADLPLSVGCTRHSPPPKIAQGSETVFVNGKPVARKGDKTECGATIAEGSPNVFFGSGQGTYVEIKPEFTGIQRALLIGVEFLVPPTALVSKGIGKAITQAGKLVTTRGPYVGAEITQKLSKIFKTIVNRIRSPQITTLLNSANQMDKNGLTKVGRALQKHGERSNSIFPKPSGNPSQINEQGLQILKNILTNPLTRKNSRHHARFGDILEYKSPIGGARFSADGKNFIGFIEP